MRSWQLMVKSENCPDRRYLQLSVAEMKPVAFSWTYSNMLAVLLYPIYTVREARVNFRERVASRQ